MILNWTRNESTFQIAAEKKNVLQGCFLRRGGLLVFAAKLLKKLDVLRGRLPGSLNNKTL